MVNGNQKLTNAEHWVGGTQAEDGAVIAAATPCDMLAHCPDNFKSKQRQDSSIKAGLSKSLALELPKDGKMQTPVMTWVNEMKHHLTKHRMQGVFCISVPQDSKSTHAHQSPHELWGRNGSTSEGPHHPVCSWRRRANH